MQSAWAGSHEAVSKGGTKEYMAPETMAHYHDPDTPRATLDPSIDAWSVGIMLLQVLFLQELPRTDPNVSVLVFMIVLNVFIYLLSLCAGHGLLHRCFVVVEVRSVLVAHVRGLCRGICP